AGINRRTGRGCQQRSPVPRIRGDKPCSGHPAAAAGIRISIDPETGYGDDVRAADKIPSDSQHGYWSVVYAATDPQANEHRDDRGFVWRPGIHMPRWASRITLEITGVRVERLNAISEADARAEGVYAVTLGAVGLMERSPPRTHRKAFELLWREINGAESWERNDWVWVIEFRRVEPGHEDADLAAHHAATRAAEGERHEHPGDHTRSTRVSR